MLLAETSGRLTVTEDEMKTKACHKTHRGETAGAVSGTFMPQSAKCLGSGCIAFHGTGSACYCADLKKDN